MSDAPTQKAFTERQRALFWRAMKSIAYADGQLVEKEPTRLRDWARRLTVPADLSDPGRLDITELSVAFREPPDRVVVFRALCDIATCDGDYHDEEDRLLADLAQEWWPPVAPRVERLDEEQRLALWHALIVLAWSDQEISAVERHLLANWAARLKVPKDLEDTRPPSVAEALRVFVGEDDRRAVLRVLHAFAIAEGPLSEPKRCLLDSIARRWQMELPR